MKRSNPHRFDQERTLVARAVFR